MPLNSPDSNRPLAKWLPARISWKPLLALIAGLSLTGCDEIWERSADGTFEEPSNRTLSRKVVGDALLDAPPKIELKDWTSGALVYVEGQGMKARDHNQRVTFKVEELSSNDYDVAGDYGDKYDTSFSLRHEPDGAFSIRMRGSSVWVRYVSKRRR
jgi:predicted Rdx family selenoprotein